MLKDRSGVAADAARHCQEDGNNCDHVGIKVRISVLECTVSTLTITANAFLKSAEAQTLEYLTVELVETP